jgi:hypothetical protein
MNNYRELFDFASRAGAFEGYVFHKEVANLKYLPRWVENLANQYQALPDDIRDEIQPLLDGTLGRALLSLLPCLGEENEIIRTLKGMIKGVILPASPEDFAKPK